MNFESSTHRNNWLFIEDDLISRRQDINARVRADALTYKKEGAADPPQVEAQDEQTLLRFYQDNLSNLLENLTSSGHYVLPKVKAAAVMYFKRHYLEHSVLETDPLPVLLYCIFLAGKVENAFVPLQALVDATRSKKMTTQHILDNEFRVLQSLHYDLIVYTPYRPLHGFLQDIQQCQRQNQEAISPELAAAGPELMARIKDKAKGAADALMLTDAPLVLPPAQLALAALRSACRSCGISLSRYLQHVAQRQDQQGQAAASSQQRLQQLLVVLDKADTFGREGAKALDSAAVKSITQASRKWWQLAAAGAAQRAAAGGQEREQRREDKLKERADAMQAVERRCLDGL